MTAAVPLRLPPRLHPVRELLVRSAEDEESRTVLDDWIAEQTWNVAQDLWLLSRPTDFQKKITIIAIGLGTTIADVAAAVKGHASTGWRYDRVNVGQYALAEAHRQLRIHRHAKYVRLVQRDAQTGPCGDEVMIDEHGMPDHKLTKEKHVRCIHFRARCRIPGCVVSSYGTHILATDNGPATLSPGTEQKP